MKQAWEAFYKLSMVGPFKLGWEACCSAVRSATQWPEGFFFAWSVFVHV